jgi:predicted metal-dependent phosphoesterase TrpH
LLKADFHIHTMYSMDSNTPLDKLIKRCLELEINCVAIADHGTTEGAIKLQQIAPFIVIVAEEVLTPHGEIMGMFLKETVPSGLSVEETISRIRAQGGLVCIPHPFDRFRPSALDGDILEEIADKVDIIEVFNARTIPFQNLTQPKIFAQKYNLKQSAGSDAHILSEIGNAYVEMPEFNGQDDFLEALAQGKICGRRTNPLVHFFSLGNRIRKKFR